MDLAHSETVDAELNRPIEKRSTREMDPDEREELWQVSVGAYTSRRSEEMRAAWREYHQGQAERHRAVLKGLIAHHEQQAAKLMKKQPKGAA